MGKDKKRIGKEKIEKRERWKKNERESEEESKRRGGIKEKEERN